MRGTTSKPAFELFKKGIQARILPITLETWQESDSWFSQAISEDTSKTFDDALALRTGYPRAWAWIAYGRALSWLEGWQADSVLDSAVAYADLAVELDPFDYDNHWVAAFVHLANRDPARADFHLEEALYLVEEDHNLHLLNEMADVLVWLGRVDEAYSLLKKTRRITDWNRWSTAWSLYFKAQSDPSLYEAAMIEAESTFWQPGQPQYEDSIQLLIAAIASQQAALLEAIDPSEAEKKRQRAQAALAEFLKNSPGWTITKELHRMPFSSAPEAQDAKNHWVDGLRKLKLQE